MQTISSWPIRSFTARLVLLALSLQWTPQALGLVAVEWDPAAASQDGSKREAGDSAGWSLAAARRVAGEATDRVEALPQWGTALLGGAKGLFLRWSELLLGSVAASSPQGPPDPPRPSGSRPKVFPQGLTALVDDAQAGIPLVPGLNLVSLLLKPLDSDPASVLAPIAGQYAAVSVFNGCDPVDPWKTYEPGSAASDLSALDHKLGFWIDALTATNFPVIGDLASLTEVPLCTGWNLVGYPLSDPLPPAAALESIQGQLVRVLAYEAADAEDPWKIYDPVVPAWANDLLVMRPGRGYWVLVTSDTTLRYRQEQLDPMVEILTPADLAEVTAPADVFGTIRLRDLQSWSLLTRPTGEIAPWREVGSGTLPIEQSQLGRFDPTLLLNGLHDLRLEARTTRGEIHEHRITVAVAGQMKIGPFTLSFTDLAIPLSGLDIEVLRTYDSRDKIQRDFGVGWSLGLRQGSYVNNRPPGEGWRIVSSGGPFGLPCEAAQETQSHLTTVRLSDREIYQFRLRLGSPALVAGGCYAQARFDFVDGPLPGSRLNILGNTQVFWGNGRDYVEDAETFEVFVPQRVRLTTRDGRIFELDLNAGVRKVEDPNGNFVTISPNGLTHSTGETVTFQRDGAGLIESISEPGGTLLRYTYDGEGNLATFADSAAATTRFSYLADHYLEGIEDPLGRSPVRNEFDDSGRLVRAFDAAGRVIELRHDLRARREVAVDRLGFVRLLEYDERGNILRETDETGGVTVRTYDAQDNLLAETDPVGRTTTYAYSANNDLVSVADGLGNTLAFTFDGAGRPLTMTDPAGQVTTHVYDDDGNLLETTDPLGQTVRRSYDSLGRMTEEIDPSGAVTTFQYDGRGRLVREIDALGRERTQTYDARGNLLTETRTRTLEDGSPQALTTRYAYDVLGRRTATTLPDGTQTALGHDLLGRITSQADALGRVTAMDYDALGRLIRTAFPDGTQTTRTYDSEDRVVSQTDAAGRTTSFTYDGAGRVLTSTLPNGSVVTNAYSPAGQLLSTTDARGNTTQTQYDEAGRQFRILDALGGSASFTYDANGNRTSATDPAGGTTTFTFDALNRPIRTTFPDGTATETVYDALGQNVEQKDELGRSTKFSYDTLGQLIGVTDALDQVTAFAYDEAGNRISQTDANGRTTAFTFDEVGRRTGRKLPDGSRETLTYQSDGTLASRTDFQGRTTTFSYDAVQRLTRRTHPNGTFVAFTYTLTGQRATATDARGTTAFAYDDLDRVQSVTVPDGRRLSYAYDAAGNRTNLTATVGAASLTTLTTFDALNRPETVTDADGEIYRHTYDANGNLASLTFPNGVRTTTTFDLRNRLTQLSTATSVGEVIQSYSLTLAATGQRMRIEEADGTARSYTYDSLNRLTQERVEDPAAALVYQQDFQYDPVGNRLSVTKDEGAGPVPTPASFDARDRILAQGSESFSWTANGTLDTKSGSEAATYRWDGEDRLIGATLADGTVVTIAYDADGNRVRTEVTPATGPPTVVNTLVDPTGSLSQAVVETDDAGNVLAHYTRADRLLSVSRPQAAEKRYYHADGLGSIRALTNPAGTVTDRYTYTAFGQLLDHTGTDPNPYQFAGEPFDSNLGLSYNRARWMDPALGRFVSMDPFGGVAQDPISLHRYLYARQDPVNRTDPSGLFSPAASLAISAGIGAGVSMLGTVAVNYLLGRTTTLREIITAGLTGAALGPILGRLGVVFPKFALGLAAAGVGGALHLAAKVFENPKSSIWQKLGAIGVVVASVLSVRVALKYYRSLRLNPKEAARTLNLGSGSNPLEGGVNIDNRYLVGVDLVGDAANLPFAPGTFSEIVSINPFKFNPVNRSVANVLKPGGLLRVVGTRTNGSFNQAANLSDDVLSGLGLARVGGIQPAEAELLFGSPSYSSGEALKSSTNFLQIVFQRISGGW